jgi:hypothetical protein
MLPTRSGLNLFISNSEYSAEIMPEYGPDILVDYAWSVLGIDPLTTAAASPAVERDQDIRWTRHAVREMKENPIAILGLKVRNVVYFFSPRLVPYHVPTATTHIELGPEGRFAVENSPPRPIVDRVVYAASYVPLLLLALAGIWLRRHDLRNDVILWCILGTFVAAHAVYFPTTRYRVPVEFVLLFYGAVSLDRFGSRRSILFSGPAKPARGAAHHPVGISQRQ